MFKDEIICPICGHKAVDKCYIEENMGIVEEYVNCTCCNYSDEFVYGNYTTTFGNYEFNYSHSVLNNDNTYALVIKKLHRAIFMARRNWRKGLRKNYVNYEETK